MLRTTQTSGSVANLVRKGVVLLIVLALLGLFAGMALTFVFYAESSAEASNMASVAQTAGAADVESELLLSFYLGQQLYPTDDIYSALRGQDLATTIFGNNNAGRNDLAFNGTGVLSYQLTHPVTGAIMDNVNLINYQAF